MRLSVGLTVRRSVLWVLLSCIGWAQEVYAHGNVVAEDDACVLKIGFYTAHFSAYQPHTRSHVEFCEDLPDTAETIFVLNYLHDSMRDVPVDLRILKDTQKLGRFARLEDVVKMDFDRDTVVYQPPVTQSDAVFTVLHDFTEPGDYIGVVTALDPKLQKVYTAVFPFSVADENWFGYAFGVLCIALLAVVITWLRASGWSRKAYSLRSSITVTHSRVPYRFLVLPALLSFFWSAQVAAEAENEPQSSQHGHFLVSYDSTDEGIDLNQIHNWIVHVETGEHAKVKDAVLTVTGGMPDHDHGLSTQPKMTRYLGEGNYLVEGMKFHMPGLWQITISVTTPVVSDSVVFDLQL